VLRSNVIDRKDAERKLSIGKTLSTIAIEARAEILVHDHVAPAADGSPICLERELTA